jgi:NADH dehydrogenase FAD-containing subunit
MLHEFAKKSETLQAHDIGAEMADELLGDPFRYHHLGSLAYIGNAAVFDLGGLSITGGLAAMYAWRSVYWSEQVSARTRALLMADWIVRCVDIVPKSFVI